jgi:hypothetical protein
MTILKISGVILDQKGKRQGTLAFAWGYFKRITNGPNVRYKPEEVIDISDNIKLISRRKFQFSHNIQCKK